MANIQYTEEFAFYQQLKFYYDSNRGKIRSRYNDLTKKFLAYNDKSENPDAFLRLPQFEALEMYVFIKEFMGKEICLFNTMTLNLAVSGITTLTSWPSSKMVPIS